jgi:UPF0176 protein
LTSISLIKFSLSVKPLSAPTEEFPIQVTALYHFFPFSNYAEERESIFAQADARGIRGSLLLAEEGLNGTIAGKPEEMNAFLTWLNDRLPMEKAEVKHSYARTIPFRRLKVRLKREIVTLGVDGIDPQQKVGQYVEPEEWDSLLADPDVTLIDTRNKYETELGKFRGAIDPSTEDFREFADYVKESLNPTTNKKVAMYCTGGIRCEKATSLLLERGFSEVYHLKGGILNYLARTDPDASSWEGECFVFDRRVSVDHHLRPGQYVLCDGCDRPLSPQDRESPLYRSGVCCEHCHDTLPEEKRRRLEERQRQRNAGEFA